MRTDSIKHLPYKILYSRWRIAFSRFSRFNDSEIWCSGVQLIKVVFSPCSNLLFSFSFSFLFCFLFSPQWYLNSLDEPTCWRFAVTARSASQQSCQTQLVARPLSVLTQCLIWQWQRSAFWLGLILLFVFPIHSSLCNIICNFPPQWWKNVLGLLCFYCSRSTVWWFSASVKSVVACAIKLLIVLPMSSQCCQLSSLRPQKHPGNYLNSHPRHSLYLPAPSFKSKQYLTVTRLKKDSWNYGLADSSDDFHAITLKFIHMNYKTIKKSSDYSFFFAPFLQKYMFGHSKRFGKIRK